MGGPRFEVNIPPSKILLKPFLAKYPISIHKMAAKNASGFLKTILLTFLTRPNVQCTVYSRQCSIVQCALGPCLVFGLIFTLYRGSLQFSLNGTDNNCAFTSEIFIKS